MKWHQNGWLVSLATPLETTITVSKFLPDFVKVITIPKDQSNNPDALRTALPGGCNLLLIDHYGLNHTYLKSLRNWADRIAVIDDLANRNYDADILIDQTLGRESSDYDDWVPNNCILLTGTGYALLRPEFSEIRMKRQKQRNKFEPPLNILVSMGAADALGITRHIVEGLMQVDLDMRVKILVGSSRDLELEELARRYPAIELLAEVNNVEDYLSETDVAIGAAGTSVWERCCLGVPSLTYIIADNQFMIGQQIRSHRSAMVYQWNDTISAQTVSEHIADFLSDKKKLTEFSINSAKICDGFGVKRACSYLEQMFNNDEKMITLRRINETDMEIILDWQREAGIRAYSRNPAIPSAEEHHRWFSTRVNDSTRVTEIILYDMEPCGMVRLDPLRNGDFEVSIFISAKFHRKGVGTAALAQIRRYMPDTNYCAEIHPANTASLNLFISAGYLKQGDNFVSRPIN